MSEASAVLFEQSDIFFNNHFSAVVSSSNLQLIEPIICCLIFWPVNRLSSIHRISCKLIINLVDDSVEFELNQIVFELLTAEFQQTLSVRVVFNNYEDEKLWVCDMNFYVMTAEIRSENLNDINIVIVRIKLTFMLFIKVLNGNIKIQRWNGGLFVRRRHYCEPTNC